MRGVGSKAHVAVPSPSSSGAGVGELLTTFQWAGVVTVSWNVALRSGCSKHAYARRASADSNCV
jgi:hypothetical protein